MTKEPEVRVRERLKIATLLVLKMEYETMSQVDYESGNIYKLEKTIKQILH